MLCQENDPCGVLQALHWTLKLKRGKNFYFSVVSRERPLWCVAGITLDAKTLTQKTFISVLCQENDPCGVLQALHWTLKLKRGKNFYFSVMSRERPLWCVAGITLNPKT